MENPDTILTEIVKTSLKIGACTIEGRKIEIWN